MSWRVVNLQVNENHHLNKLCIAVEVGLNAMDEENVDVVSFVQKQHGPKVTDPFVSKLGAGDELQTLHLRWKT